MKQSNQSAFRFISRGLPEDTFAVSAFTGTEGLSQLYRFEIQLTSKNAGLDTQALANAPARLVLTHPQGDLPFHGMLEVFELGERRRDKTAYRAVLRPRLWWLTRMRDSQVFLDQSCDAFLSDVLQQGGLLPEQDFTFRLENAYKPREFTAQYKESHFDFFSRWLEREGLYYFFEQKEHGEKCVITDNYMAHAAMREDNLLRYAPQSGLRSPYELEVLTRFACHQLRQPEKVVVKDYHYLTPRVPIEGRAAVEQGNQGELYEYGPHCQDVEEAQRLATVRSQEYGCRKTQFHGDGVSPLIRSGYLFRMEGHFRDECNGEFLATSVQHEGKLPESSASADTQQSAYYRNSFWAIPAERQFRAERKTPWPRIGGALPAHIDAEGSDQYAHLDEHGRYRVILPFDLAGHEPGHASAWVRMLQPYGGKDHGMHFPLHKGTEVVLTFINGDPDRPTIAYAMSNPEQPSLITAETRTMAKLTTSGQNTIHMEDMAGSRRILMQTPSSNTFLRIGAPNDPPSGLADNPNWSKAEDSPGFYLHTKDGFSVYCGWSSETILGENAMYVGGVYTHTVGGISTETDVSFNFAWTDPISLSYSPVHTLWTRKLRKLCGVKEFLCEENESLGEIQMELHEKVTEMHAAVEKIKQRHAAIANKKISLNEQKTSIGYTKSAIGLNIERLKGANTELEAESRALLDEQMQVSGKHEVLTEKYDGLKREEILLTAKKESIQKNITKLEMSSIDLNSEKTILSDQVILV